jgi:hypothetical protein
METVISSALLRLDDSDRARLGEALRILVERGSILGSEKAYADLYSWCFANRPWLEELTALLELQLFWEHESRLVQAVPRSRSFLLKLRLDATLVLMTLWYEFDTAVRDRGEAPPVTLTAEQLNDSLDAKFRPLRKAMPGHSRLLEILRLAQRRNLLRFTAAADPAQTRIEVLSTIKRVIPFQGLEDWARYARRFVVGTNERGETDVTALDISDESDAEN